ncbi:DUF92 domain-containing protein [Chitinophagaceae bacterium MMS25-I14]
MTSGLQNLLFILFLLLAVAASIKARKLTPVGAVTGGLLGCLVFVGAGFWGIAMVAFFFLLGTLATSWKKDFKVRNGMSEQGSSRRNAGQVLANAGVAAICGACGYLFPEHIGMFRLMMAASLSAATADTLSSELGNVYGRNFYNVLTFKKDTRGLDGVVSLEGTIIGVAGSSFIALIYMCGFGFSWSTFMVLLLAGTFGNFTDSFLGAWLERRQLIGNDLVNACNTLAAALFALLLQLLTSN